MIPDAFDGSPGSVTALMKRMQEHAGLSDLRVELGIVSPEGDALKVGLMVKLGVAVRVGVGDQLGVWVALGLKVGVPKVKLTRSTQAASEPDTTLPSLE